MMTDQRGGEAGRGTVSVVVPFFGDESAAQRAAARLAEIELVDGDEVIVVDNTPDGVFVRVAAGSGIRVVGATGERSSYHARNVGAGAARGDWILFIDADCEAPPDIIDRYLDDPPPPEVALLAGPIVASSGQSGLLPEWAATREILSQRQSVAQQPPAAATANLMVQAGAWAAVGGFLEGIRSGGDFEFCWRVADWGGALSYREGAAVAHLHRTTLRGIARQMARYAAGNAWQRRRRPGVAAPAPAARSLLRALGGAAFFALTLRPRRAALKGVDGVAAIAQATGRRLSNSVAGPLGFERLVVATDRFPVPSETFITGEIATLRALGQELRVEALVRPPTPALGAVHGLDVRYLEDETIAGRLRALLWAVARHPLRALADLPLRRRFAEDERMPLSAIAPMAQRLARGGVGHVHVHFAALAAVNALRAARIAGVRVSVAAHGHEVFATPRALPEKLTRAAFVAAPCEYTARHLREVAPRARIEVVVMGVDGERFRRRRPYPGGRVVVAVGRLVEKKGFDELIAAVGLLADGEVDRVLIAGDGPMRDALAERVRALGAGARVALVGALDPAGVRDLLEAADLAAVPCIVAADGDRDAMPVVAKEALAMEIPVLGTDEVGLPELIGDGWGRLVAPGDPAALAAGIAELLALPATERAEMGRAGREFVLERFDQASQARKLLDLIDDLGPA